MYDFKGKSDWQGGYADTSDYGYPDNGVFFGKIQSVFFNENQKQDGTVTVSLSITATNDSHKQKVTFSIPYYNKARTSLSVLATQLLFLRGFDTDNLNITATALTNKDGQQVLNKRTNQPVYMLPELEGTEFICLLKKNGGKTNADGTFTPYFNVYGWNFYNSFGFSVLEIKTGNKTTGTGTAVQGRRIYRTGTAVRTATAEHDTATGTTTATTTATGIQSTYSATVRE